MSIKIEFDVKYGHNVIDVDLPINKGDKLYPDSGKGLSNFFDKTFTIINQIPTSQTVATKRKWNKYSLPQCNFENTITDKSVNTMQNVSSSWIVRTKDIEHYKAPNWIDGYYTLPDYEKDNFYTVAVGDLIIFAEIEDVTPTTQAEFNALKSKYANISGTVKSATQRVYDRANGTLFRQNNIEIIG